MGHRTPRRNRIEPNQRGIREGGEEKQRAEGAGRRRAYPAPRETRRVLACGRAAGIGGRRGIGDGGREPSRVWLVDAGVVAGWGGNGDEARRDEASETAGGRARDQRRDGKEAAQRRHRHKPDERSGGFRVGAGAWVAMPRWSTALRVGLVTRVVGVGTARAVLRGRGSGGGAPATARSSNFFLFTLLYFFSLKFRKSCLTLFLNR